MKFITYWIFAYVIFRIAKIFIDPFFDKTPSKQSSGGGTIINTNNQKQTTSKNTSNADYIEYTEVK